MVVESKDPLEKETLKRFECQPQRAQRNGPQRECKDFIVELFVLLLIFLCASCVIQSGVEGAVK